MTRLSESGELGLLAELERRGLIVGVEHDAALLGDGSRGHPGRARRGRALSPRLDRLARARLSRRRRQPERSRRLGRRAGGTARDPGAARASTETADVVELYEGIAEAGVPVVGGDTTASAAVLISRHRPRPERARPGPGGRACRETCSSSPARSAVPARRFAPGRTCARRCASRRGRRSRGARMRCSTSRTGSPSTPGTLRDGQASGSRSSSTPCRSLPARPSPISASARTSSCWPPFADAGALPVIGQRRPGEGVAPAPCRRAVRALRLGALPRSEVGLELLLEVLLRPRAVDGLARALRPGRASRSAATARLKRSAVRRFTSMSSFTNSTLSLAACELLEGGLDRLAGAAPRRPEVDDDGLRLRSGPRRRTFRR